MDTSPVKRDQTLSGALAAGGQRGVARWLPWARPAIADSGAGRASPAPLCGSLHCIEVWMRCVGRPCLLHEPTSLFVGMKQVLWPVRPPVPFLAVGLVYTSVPETSVCTEVDALTFASRCQAAVGARIPSRPTHQFAIGRLRAWGKAQRSYIVQRNFRGAGHDAWRHARSSAGAMLPLPYFRDLVRCLLSCAKSVLRPACAGVVQRGSASQGVRVRGGCRIAVNTRLESIGAARIDFTFTRRRRPACLSSLQCECARFSAFGGIGV
jgi:hypothetical protein